MNYPEIKIHWQNRLHGIYSDREVHLLLERTLKDILKKDLGLIRDSSLDLNESESLRLEEVLKRLISGEPFQYIQGMAPFMDFWVKVSPDVLIPRPETEELVQWVFDDFKTKKLEKAIDFCTGSGCIAVALKKHFPQTEVSAIDISEAALSLAEENAAINNCDIQFYPLDILKDEPEESMRYDVMISNPPYVPFSDKPAMSKTVVDFEPSLALFVPDQDALIFYRRILFLAEKYLQPHGCLYFEIHEKMGEELMRLVNSKGVFSANLSKDLSGNFRLLKVVFRK